MKALGIVTILILGYLAWRWFAPAPTQPSPLNPTPARPAPTKAAVAQQPVARPTPTPPVMPQRRLAPDNTFFLLQRASLTIDSGVIGFTPGTKVTLVNYGDSVATVTDGQYQFTVPSSQLTNDLDVAASIANSDYAAQVRIAELTAKWAEEYEQQQRDALTASEKEKAQKKKQPRAAPRSSIPPQHR